MRADRMTIEEKMARKLDANISTELVVNNLTPLFHTIDIPRMAQFMFHND